MVERLLLAAALAAALPPQALADTFACRGRDPAWELLGQGDQAMLTRDRTPGHRLLTGKSATLQAEGVVVWRGRSTDGQPDVVVTMLKGACTDPRAGDISGYLGIVSPSNGDPFVGCCSFGPQPVTTADASPPAPGAPPARAVAAPAPLQAPSAPPARTVAPPAPLQAPEPQVDDAPPPRPRLPTPSRRHLLRHRPRRRQVLRRPSRLPPSGPAPPPASPPTRPPACGCAPGPTRTRPRSARSLAGGRSWCATSRCTAARPGTGSRAGACRPPPGCAATSWKAAESGARPGGGGGMDELLRKPAREVVRLLGRREVGAGRAGPLGAGADRRGRPAGERGADGLRRARAGAGEGDRGGTTAGGPARLAGRAAGASSRT